MRCADGRIGQSPWCPVTTFNDYATDFRDDLLPIIPPDAVLNAKSKLLPRSRGKLPGRKRGGVWCGFMGWTRYRATADDMLKWQGWEAGIGMQGRRFPAIDIDVDVPELADAIHDTFEKALGPGPVRFGNGSRRVLPFAAEGLRKRRLAFQAKDPARRTKELQAVELLGAGQQYVVEGIHRDTGQPYHWRDGISPVTVGADGLQAITSDQIDAVFDSLPNLLDSFGYEVVSQSVATATGLATARSGIASQSASPASRNKCGVWQEGLVAPSLEAVGRALEALANEFDYHDWLTIGMAIKAACGPENAAAGYDLFEEWSLGWEQNTHDDILSKWDSMRAPFRVGWPYLAALAEEKGDGSFYAAHEDFDAVEPTPSSEELAARADANPLTAMFRRSVWVRRLKLVYDLSTGDLQDRQQFNVANNHIGDPSSPTKSAWATLLRDKSRLQRVNALTYRPGAGPFVTEDLPGLVGPCVNRWRDPSAGLPDSASDADVQRWLEHVAVVIPDERERGIVLDWLAWIIQNPGEKPNWCLVIGSRAEGIGKDLMLAPIRMALGGANVREIGPDDLNSDFTDYLANTRLLIVEEMQMSERKAMQNKLKPLIAAPPKTLRVNEKFVPCYQVPNIVTPIFFTNMDNALAVSRQDRRYFVVWNEGQPRTADYFRSLVEWYESGGAALAARWLQQRDVTEFNAKGAAPMTSAKQDMRKATLPEADALIVEAMEHCDPPFHRRFIRLTDVLQFLDTEMNGLCRVNRQQLARKLKAAGALALGRVTVGNPPSGIDPPPNHDRKQMQLFVMPGDAAALELRNEPGALSEAFWLDWKAGLDAVEREEANDRLFS
jgi:hypothetical protein